MPLCHASPQQHSLSPLHVTQELSVEQLHQQLAALQAQVESLQTDNAQMQQKINLLIAKLNLSLRYPHKYIK
ncbi:MAG: hypothetical protein ACPGSN_11750 [Psychrobium sp.]